MTDITEKMAKLKWPWAAHVARKNDSKWKTKLLNW